MYKYRSAMSRFRCSSHSLAVETGRYDGTLMEQRICILCEKQGIIVVEDEYHFLLCCPSFQALREVYIRRDFFSPPSFVNFLSLMSSDEPVVIKNCATYLLKAGKLRQELLNEMSTRE